GRRSLAWPGRATAGRARGAGDVPRQLWRSLCFPSHQGLPEVLGNSLNQPFRDLFLRHAWPALAAFLIDQSALVVVTAKISAFGAHIIGQDPIAAFALPFCARVFYQPLGFGGEADAQCRAQVLMTRGLCEDIGIFFQFQFGGTSPLFLELLCRLLGAPVRHRGRPSPLILRAATPPP